MRGLLIYAKKRTQQETCLTPLDCSRDVRQVALSGFWMLAVESRGLIDWSEVAHGESDTSFSDDLE